MHAALAAAVAVALLCLLPVAPLEAAATDWDEYQSEKQRQNFAGWKGIVFLCVVPDHANQSVKDVCTRALTDAEFLAAASKVKLESARNYTDWYIRAAKGDLLLLNLVVSSTKRGSPTGVHMALKAEISYSNAVERGEPTKGARGLPRKGYLVMWEQDATGATTGEGTELLEQLAGAAEQMLKRFFTDYLKYRQ